MIDDFYDGLAYPLTTLAYDTAPPVRPDPLEAPLALARNPLSEPNLTRTSRQEIVPQGGMMGSGKLAGIGGMMGMGMPAGMNRGAAWATNGMSMTGDGHVGMAPHFTLERGASPPSPSRLCQDHRARPVAAQLPCRAQSRRPRRW